MTWATVNSRVVSFIQRYPLKISLGLGLFLRLIGLESRSLQYDDVFSIFLSSRSLPEIVSGTAADTMPPLYYFLLHYWLEISRAVWFIRFLSVLLTLLAILLLYRIGEYWLGRDAAGWGAFLAAISPLFIYHGQDVRMYALLVAALLGHLWFFTRIWERDQSSRPRLMDWFGLVLCGAAAMYSHNVAIFALAALDFFLLMRKKWILLGRLIAAQIVIGLMALPWLLLIPGQIAKVQKAWTFPLPGLVEILQAIVMFTSSLPLPVPLLALAMLLSFQIVVVLGLEIRRAWKQSPEFQSALSFALILALFPPFFLFLASYLMKPVFIPRAFLISSLAFDLLAGFIIAKTWSRGVGKLMLLAFVSAALISLPEHYSYQSFPRSPYREAVNFLEKAITPGERVIHETKLSYFPSAFYAPDLPQVFLADPPDSPNDTLELGSQKALQIFPETDISSAIDRHCVDCSGIYFITFTQTFREYAQQGLPDNPNIAWLKNNFHLIDHKIFSDLEIFYFQR